MLQVTLLVHLVAEAKELMNAQKQLVAYKKEVIDLKRVIEIGNSKVMEAESKLAQSLVITKTLLKKIKELKREQNNQGKELENIVIAQEYEGEIRFLSENVKQLKIRAKELEDKHLFLKSNNAKTKDYFESLKQKYMEFKSKQSTSYTQQESLSIEIKDNSKLQNEYKELKALLDKQRSDNRKEEESVRLEVQSLRKKVKELELVNRLNALKLKELVRVNKGAHNTKRVLIANKCRIKHREKFSLLRSNRDRNSLSVILVLIM
jgi:chromosome segregation ATPase